MKETARRNTETARMRNYAWNYFELHANQRMSTFKFFITLVVFMTTSLGASIVQELYSIGTLLGLLLIVISFVFYKLDERVRTLIENSELALKDLEGVFEGLILKKPSEVQLFRFEEMATERRKRITRSKCSFWRAYLSYRQCFNIIFWVFGLIGLLGTTVSILMLFANFSLGCGSSDNSFT